MTATTAHIDTFARDNLPPREQWPLLRFDLVEGLDYPDRLNACVELLDKAIDEGDGDRPCLIGEGINWSYAETRAMVNRIANVLVGELGVVPGNRVLLRSANLPMAVAIYLAIIKAGAIVVATMPLLRARELAKVVSKAEISLAICQSDLLHEMQGVEAITGASLRIVPFGGGSELDDMVSRASPDFTACDTAAEDVCLIGFTSGTTGQPKGTMHFHRDLLATCDTFGRHVLKAGKDDIFIGSPPLAFTFGLGGLVLFPLRARASTVLLPMLPPDRMLDAIEHYRPSICFTAPTAYRAMMAQGEGRDLSSLRKTVSAGETLPATTFEAWHERTGIRMLDGLGSTEMLHIFICAPEEQMIAGATGIVVPGYEARIIDDDGNEVPDGTPGRLAVRGPTGCRYLADDRQKVYVEDGWNITGDVYTRDDKGYYRYQARADDMIISAGYNIAGPEVEQALMTHPAVLECGVVGAPDPDRGQIVQAYVVLKPGETASDALIKSMQDHVKNEISPYKYPRRFIFTDSLPKTQTGKLQRAGLRDRAAKGE